MSGSRLGVRGRRTIRPEIRHDSVHDNTTEIEPDLLADVEPLAFELHTTPLLGDVELEAGLALEVVLGPVSTGVVRDVPTTAVMFSLPGTGPSSMASTM